MKRYWYLILVILPLGIVIVGSIWYFKRRSCKKKKEELIKKMAELQAKIDEAGMGGGVEEEFQLAEAKKEFGDIKC